MKLDFYYWSYQCPINHEMLNLLSLYKRKVNITIYDISYHPELAKEKKIFFPTLTVVNSNKRYFSPLNTNFMETLCQGKLPIEELYFPQLATIEYTGKIVPLTPDNYCLAEACTARRSQDNRVKKQCFLRQSGLDICGFLNLDKSDVLLGGVEYMPSVLVPYDIPKDERTAFITCIYLSSDLYDYKSTPLRRLEEYLHGKYDKVLVISDEKGTFPNGDKAFFEKNGYSDDGIVSYEKEYCTLHLMSKNLL
jgi:hypothetical protein